MKFSSKRLLAAVLAFVLVLSLFPVTQPMHVHAATALTTSVDGLTASWDYNSNNKNGNYTASGNSITGTATGGFLNRTTIVLTLTNDSDGEATLKFTYSKSGGTLSGAISSASGTYEAVLAKGASVNINFQSGRNQTNTLSITDISLISTSAADPNLTFKPGANGSYTVNGTAVTAETKMTVSAGAELALVATPASGYQFYGWQKADGTYISQNASYTLTASADMEIAPVFISNSIALFGVGQTKYDNLTEAGKAAAAGTNKTIILLNNGTVSGNHTIPAGTTLLIPYDDANTAYGASASCTSWTSLINSNGHVAWESPSAYRTLTLAGDANITVNGNIEVGGRHAAAGGKLGKYGGSPTGKLGYINMLSGSHIDLNSGANLFCWGYVYGEGTITAKNGASIYENFQIMDFRGGSITSELASSYLVFPLSQYYVQNVEVATRYEYGAAEYIATSIFMSNSCHSATVKFIGADAMFQPAAGSYFIKDYNPATDMLEMHAYGDSVMASMNLELGGTAIDSSTFVLPITNNIQINLHSGTTTLKQNMMLLPGSSLTVGKDAILNLAYTDQTGEVVTAGGHVLQIFDSENWFKGLNMDTLETVNGLYYIHPSKNLTPLEYTCSARKNRTVADLTDVTLDINGKVITDGFLYSTVTWADALNDDFTIVSGGANIISSEKTGKVIMNNGAGQDQLGYLFSQSDATYYFIPLASAQLKNGDGSLLDTSFAEPGTEYHYCAPCDCWYTGEHTCAPTKVEITWIINGEPTAQEFDYNVVPSCDLNPAKAYDANAHYVFKGWATSENGAVLATLPNATSDAAYYAVFEAVAHIYTNEIARTDATCMAEGSVTKQCACGATETTNLPIDKDNHTGNNTTGVNAKEPTCGAEGYTGDTVCECGATVAYGTSIPATGNHNYTNEIARTDATCMAEGSVTKQCACGATETTNLPIDKDNHTGEIVYTNNGDTHSAVYDCCNGEFVTGESHDYTTGDADYTCICGAIETFTVTWLLNGGVLDEQTKQSLINEGFVITDTYVSNAFPYGEFAPNAPGISKTGYTLVGYTDQDGNSYQGQDKFTLNQNMTFTLDWEINTYTLTVSVLATGDIVELTVPYGANLLEILAQAAEDGKIPAIGDKFRVINEYENGMYFISGYSYFVEAEDWWYDVEEASTMPAADFEIDQDWSMFTGWIYSDVDEDGTFDGAEYYDARNDNPFLTGWQYIEEDYDDIPGGAWYYFFSYMDEYGFPYHFRAEGISRVPYNTELGYGPDQETVDYAQANGIEFIDATTGLFVFDENGKFQMNYTGPVIDGEFARYAVNGHIAWHVGMVENQGAYFYFTGDEVNGGNVMATGDVYVIRNTSDFPAVIGGIYTFDVDGSLKIFKGIVENDLFEGKRYYVAGRLMIGYGLCDITEKVDGEWVTNYFYVKSDGTLAVNTRYWVAKTNGLNFAVGEYEFDENGFMIIPVEEPAKDGIYFENGAWYYYENGTIGYNKGLIFTDKNWYDADGNDVWGEGGIIYVRSNGKLATGTYYVTNLSNYSQIVDVVAGTPLQFSDMGLMSGLKNGIINGYYYVNNQIAYAAGLVEIDGNYYYVRSNGQVVMGRDYWISNANDTGIKLGCYTFDENGVMQLPDTYGFTGIKDGYYYVDGAVAYGAGMVMLDDGTYIYVRSNGQLAVGKYWPTTLNGYLPAGEYDFGEDGILTVE